MVVILPLLSFFAGAIIGLIAAFLATPLLWKLEEPTGLELAGHSGPAESVVFIFAVVFGAASAGLFLLSRKHAAKKERP